MYRRYRALGLCALIGLGGVAFAAPPAGGGGMEVAVLPAPKLSATTINAYYVGNRAPLLPDALVKLPIGSIKAQGWLLGQLQAMENGFPGHLPEVSHWAQFTNNAWTSPTGQGPNGWEEVPYWLRGYGDLGYVLRDGRITQEFEKWTDAILASQRPDGYFGPEENHVHHDIWPNMLALYALRTRYEATGDKRILPFMLRYFQWLKTLPEDQYLPGSWQKIRGGDNLDSIYWLYDRTGEKWLLDLAEFNHKRTLDWTDKLASLHGVDLAQSFREPATYYQQTHDPRFLEATIRDYNQYWGTWGQVPGGMYGADENARPGRTGPRQAAEACAMVEAMFSHEILEGITGDPVWADRCEDVAFNSLPASMTPDGRAVHYLTAPNMVQLDHENKAPGIQNRGTMLSYDPGEVYRCCQHNVVMGWPYFTEHLWMATPDNGIAAVLYAPNTVTAKVGESGASVTVTQTTDYPFDGAIHLTLAAAKPVRFPLLLRVPGWCSGVPTVQVNGAAVALTESSLPGKWVRLERTWKAGDTVSLTLPMPLRTKTWTENRDTVSVYRGPLAFSLKIGERMQRYGGTDTWPAFDVFPTTPWNYGLVVNNADPAASLTVVRKPGPVPAQPFTPEASPISLVATGRRIPNWQQDAKGLVEEVVPGPIRSDQPEEKITLIPMGAARLRISAFPQIGTGPEAKVWPAPMMRDATFAYSHLFEADSPLDIADRTVPKGSDDRDIPRFTWWDHKGTAEWVEYDFPTARKVSSASVYWYDDTAHGGGCRIPASWQLLAWDGTAWQPVKNASPYDTAQNRYNRVTFDPVSTTKLRLAVVLQSGFSGGILAWHINDDASAAAIASVAAPATHSGSQENGTR